MTKSGETATFTYNSDGLRVKKVCTTTGTTNYILHGKNIAHLTNGSNALHFFYDAQNRPAIVVYNGTAYGYVHNLQGDIIAIVDSAGTKVVECKYDAWGKPLSKTGSMASALGKWNPFRYRDYVYDKETNLYYIQTRFYSSNTCRFVSHDSEVGRIQPLTHNLFTYCLNAPPIRIDNTGTKSYAVGTVFSGSFGASASFSSGYCWDDEGNFGSYITYVGIDHDIEQIIKKPTVGLGGFSASIGLTYQEYPNKSIKDIVGPGLYFGFGGDAWGYSVGIDGINTLAPDETYADSMHTNRPLDGYQYSLNLGVGAELAHTGTSNTYVMLFFENGKYIPLLQRKFVNLFPEGK